MAGIYNTLLRTSVVYTLTAALTSGLSLILLPLYTRVLSPGDYGSLDLMILFANLANLVIALEVIQGMGRYYTQETNPEHRRSYAGTALVFTLLCHALFFLCMFFFAPHLAPLILGQDGLVPEFRTGALFIVVNSLYLVAQAVLRWQFRARGYALVSLVYATVTGFASLAFAFVFDLGLSGFLWGMVAGAGAGLVSALRLLRGEIRYGLDLYSLAEMLRFSVLLVPSSLSVFFGAYIDRLMISAFLGTEQVGVFAVGYRVASLLMFAVIGIRGSLTPLVYTHSDSPDTPDQLAVIFRVFIAASIVFYALLGLFSADIIGLLSTDEYRGAARVVVLLAPALLLSQMYIFAPGMGIRKRAGIIATLNFVGMSFNAALNYLLIPRFGVEGAAAATLLGYTLAFALFMYSSQRLYPVPHQWKNISLISLLAFASVTLFSRLELDFVFRIALNLLVVAGLCLACIKARLVSLSEIGSLRSIRAMPSRKSV